MKLSVDKELKQICEEIISKSLNLTQWSKLESDDMFQTANYCGGFDSAEDAFCFSFYQNENKEFWFQITIDEVEKILSGKINEITTRPADS